MGIWGWGEGKQISLESIRREVGWGLYIENIFQRQMLGNEGTGIRRPLLTSISVHVYMVRSEISAGESGSLSLSF